MVITFNSLYEVIDRSRFETLIVSYDYSPEERKHKKSFRLKTNSTESIAKILDEVLEIDKIDYGPSFINVYCHLTPRLTDIIKDERNYLDGDQQ